MTNPLCHKRQHVGLLRICYLLLLATLIGCTDEQAGYGDSPEPSRVEIRTENIGGFQLSYASEPLGHIVQARAETCLRKLDYPPISELVASIHLTKLPEEFDRIIVLASMNSSHGGVDVITVGVSNGVGRWSKLQPLNTVDQEDDLTPLIGDVPAGFIEALSTPLDKIELQPNQLDGMISNQHCYFLKILDSTGSSSKLLLSDMIPVPGHRSGRVSFTDVVSYVFDATSL